MLDLYRVFHGKTCGGVVEEGGCSYGKVRLKNFFPYSHGEIEIFTFTQRPFNTTEQTRPSAGDGGS